MQRSTSFGRTIRQRRKALDLTQAALAQQVGCAEITIRKLEADEIRPSRQFLARLADQLGVDIRERAAFLESGRATHSEPTNNLPVPPNLLIGRETELAAVRAHFQGDVVRLLTLTGPGGAGKTRLALEAARGLAGTFRDGVCFVSLAAISDPERVASTIAQALGIDEHAAASPMEHLTQFLKDTALLLVLDNFEQVVAAAPLVANLLSHAPDLRVLATSRVPLHVSGEHEFVVPPLALPLAPAASAEQPVASPAVALFVARARAVRADFVLTPENAPIVAEICARLDGLPLAIELAAAWIKLLTPEALLARLSGSQPLELLAGGARDLPVRQQTLRNAMSWSYDLLLPDAQSLFRLLGVCVGGCTLDEVEALAAELTPASTHVLAAVATLVDGSLLRRETDHFGIVRVVMLETIREYALELLAESGELDRMKQRHARLFLALAEQARLHLQDDQQARWLDRLDAEHNNFRAALAWSCSSTGDAAVGIQLAEVLWEFWLVRGYVSEGRSWIGLLLGLEQTPSVARARLLGGAGRLAWAQNDWEQATELLEQSHALCVELGDVTGSAVALNHLGEVAEAQGRYGQAADFFAHSLASFERLYDREGSASALVSYGQMMQAQGHHERAAELVAASLSLFEALGDRRGLGVALTVQGQVMTALGENERAAQLFAQSLELFQSIGYRHGVGWALTNLGQTALAQHDFGRAEQSFAESLDLYAVLGDERGQAWAMSNQGQAAHALGDTARGLALLERSVALFDALGDRRGYAWALYNAGHTMCAANSDARAAGYLLESLRIFHALGDARYSADCLVDLAALCVADHPRVAVQLYAVAAALRNQGDAPNNAEEGAAFLAQLRTQLGDAKFEKLWEKASTLTIEEALEMVEQARI